ncbi:6-phosphogluconolactonase [bacterium]|nr:6-phosphogluconolactonase [bacterium]
MSTSRETMLCEFPEDVAVAAAALIHEAQTQAIKARGVFRIALSGGNTPRLLFDRLAREWLDNMKWEKREVYWTDERSVPSTDEHSNYKLAKDHLLSHVAVKNSFRIPAEANDLHAVVVAYSSTLKKQFASDNPVFDVILLGIGSDGHVASLFPGSPLLESGSLLAVAESDSHAQKRVTFTLRTINKARLILFLVAGERKADAVREVLVKGNYALPAARIDSPYGRVVWIIDKAASSKIT